MAETMGIVMSRISPYHSQGNGRIERRWRDLRFLLRAMVNRTGTNWAELLPCLEYSMNTKTCASTGFSPMELLFGYHPTWTFLVPEGSPKRGQEVPDKRLTLLHETREMAIKMMEEQAVRMEHYANRKRGVTPHFEVGDYVFVSSENLKLKQPCEKLKPVFLGPYVITKRVNDVTYHVGLPADMHNKPVFHCSLLRKCDEQPSEFNPPSELAIAEEEGRLFRIEQLVDSRLVDRRNGMEFLVKWMFEPDDHNTWEFATNLLEFQDLIEEFYERHPTAVGYNNMRVRHRHFSQKEVDKKVTKQNNKVNAGGRLRQEQSVEVPTRRSDRLKASGAGQESIGVQDKFHGV